MMSYGQVSGKIIKRKNKTGYSYNFLLVKNRRSYLTGKSEHFIIHNWGTLKDSDFTDEIKVLGFWKEVADVLANLTNSGEIDSTCPREVQAKFAKLVPMPVVSNKITIRPQANQSVGERLRKRFKDLL